MSLQSITSAMKSLTPILRPLRPILLTSFFVSAVALGVSAQTPGTYVQPTSPATGAGAAPSPNALAAMSDDIEALKRQLGQLRLDVQNLQQENDSLRKQIVSQADINASVQNAVAKYRDDTNKAINQAITQANGDLRKDIVAAVTKQIEALARDTNTQLQTLAKAIGKPPPVSSHVTATDPNQTPPPPSNEKVELYVVKAGESISKIAARYHVSVAEIGRVNPTLDLNKVREGQQVAIPLKNGAAAPAATN